MHYVMRENDNQEPTEFQKQMRPWFLSLLLIQGVLVGLRWWVGDFHGALLMGIVTLVGLLVVTVDVGIDIVYCTYYGLMSFVSGLMDFAIVLEAVAWHPWHHVQPEKVPFIHTLSPVVHLLCCVAQLSAAFLCYHLYQDAEEAEEEGANGPLFSTQEQAQIYNAVLQHSQRRPPSNQEEASGGSVGGSDVKPFAGMAHRLP